MYSSLSITFRPKKLSDGEVSSTHLPNCQPVNNILFLKTHKTGSSTMTNILNRYGDYGDLLFALPSNPKKYDFQWPQPFRLNMLSLKGTSNILCNHARYNKAPMNWLFPKETTRYITMLRDPTKQFESVFNFYGIGRVFRKLSNGAPPLEHFLQNATFYFKKFVKKSKYIHLLKNPALFDLGLDTEHHEDFTVVRNYIRFLQQEFDLVILTEYFDESLVLLKRRFCWKTEDILYFKLNERIDTEKQDLSKFTRGQIRKWNSGDVLLYQSFNQTLWNMIEEEGADFFKDLSLFRKAKNIIAQACLQKGDFLTIPFQKKVVRGYAVKANISKTWNETCTKMIMNEVPYMDYLREKLAKQQEAP